MPLARSRYLSTVTCVTRNQPVSVAPRRTIRRTDQNALRPPAIRPTHETVVTITPTTSNAPHRQSSPKLDISSDIARLVINDSVASAVLPACNHRVDPRRRSISADSVRVSGPIPSSVTEHDQTNYVNDLERPTTASDSPATHVILNVIKKRLDTLLEQQTRHNLVSAILCRDFVCLHLHEADQYVGFNNVKVCIYTDLSFGTIDCTTTSKR
ncbi:hypothetical protein FGIG_09284 [Fasciola gigantica]|uniref:Uncharacterized protein n=1 Tax=Fasciola gigantica TaxID=46835 RepID=A0A504YNP4_FASGI|nr:hypothetical protein FGIG_09284 [Fasciola gigantica]